MISWFIRIVSVLVLALPLAAGAQPTKVSRIGVLAPAEPGPNAPVLQGFRLGLRELGYTEGHNIIVEYTFARGQAERFPDLLGELARRNVDILVVGSSQAARAAKEASPTTPIVFVGAGDPVASGLVASLGRPGGHVTGLSFGWSEGFAGKWVEMLREVAPQATRVAILRHKAFPASATIARDTERAGRALGLTLQRFEVSGPDDLPAVFNAITKVGAGAFLIEPTPFFLSHQRIVVDLAARHRLPGMFHHRAFVEAGGLISYGVSLADLWRRAAYYVDRIIKGARPGDLPVEQPTKFEMVLNAKTAKTMGLAIPPSLLLRADHVIE
ncbi:MAG: ABC transporter substrate-binding protein [Gammaproteobacteria bacterium]